MSLKLLTLVIGASVELLVSQSVSQLFIIHHIGIEESLLCQALSQALWWHLVNDSLCVQKNLEGRKNTK